MIVSTVDCTSCELFSFVCHAPLDAFSSLEVDKQSCSCSMLLQCSFSVSPVFTSIFHREIKLKLVCDFARKIHKNSNLNWHLPNFAQRTVDRSNRQLNQANCRWIAQNSRGKFAYQPRLRHHWLECLWELRLHTGGRTVHVPAARRQH